MKVKKNSAFDSVSVDTGERLRAARSKAGVTRKRLAAASGASERYLALLEAGEGNPSLGVLKLLADALDIPVAELLPLGGERNEVYSKAAALLRRLPERRLLDFEAWVNEGGVEDSVKARRIVLIGLRGAGKTSLGQGLAERMGVPFIEMSTEIERIYGGDIGLLIELGGQAALRRHEQQVWDMICESHPAAIIAASGGVVADSSLYGHMLSTAHSIWLRASPEDHMKRVMAQGDFRPMASNRGAMGDLKAILDARMAEYARADVEVDTSAQDFDVTLDVTEKVARKMVGGSQSGA